MSALEKVFEMARLCANSQYDAAERHEVIDIAYAELAKKDAALEELRIMPDYPHEAIADYDQLKDIADEMAEAISGNIRVDAEISMQKYYAWLRRTKAGDE